MATIRQDLPQDLDALRAALRAERARAARVEAELAVTMRVPVDRDHGFRWKVITQSGGT